MVRKVFCVRGWSKKFCPCRYIPKTIAENITFVKVCYFDLSLDVAVVQWITLCHKNRMTTRVTKLWWVHVTSLTTSMSSMRFLIEIMFVLKPIKSHFKGSYDKQNLTQMAISYEIY